MTPLVAPLSTKLNVTTALLSAKNMVWDNTQSPLFVTAWRGMACTNRHAQDPGYATATYWYIVQIHCLPHATTFCLAVGYTLCCQLTAFNL